LANGRTDHHRADRVVLTSVGRLAAFGGTDDEIRAAGPLDALQNCKFKSEVRSWSVSVA